MTFKMVDPSILHPRGIAMDKLRVLILPCMLLLAALCVSAQSTQLDLPRQSQKAQITQRIGITDITIVYHRRWSMAGRSSVASCLR